MKKKKQKKRPRITTLNFELKDEHVNPETGNVEVGIVMDMVNGESYMVNQKDNSKIGTTSIQYGYKGLNKWRVTSQINSDELDNGFCFNCKHNRFKHVIAIDTNLVYYNSELTKDKLYIGLGIAFALLDEEESIDVKPIPLPFITNYNPEKPENENWVRVIEFMKSKCKCDDKRPIGIVVDSDLGNIPAYNKRDEPIFQNYFLPDGFELIFASDKVSDNIYNKMIRISHKASKNYMPKFIQIMEESEVKTLAEHRKNNVQNDE